MTYHGLTRCHQDVSFLLQFLQSRNYRTLTFLELFANPVCEWPLHLFMFFLRSLRQRLSHVFFFVWFSGVETYTHIFLCLWRQQNAMLLNFFQLWCFPRELDHESILLLICFIGFYWSVCFYDLSVTTCRFFILNINPLLHQTKKQILFLFFSSIFLTNCILFINKLKHILQFTFYIF